MKEEIYFIDDNCDNGILDDDFLWDDDFLTPQSTKSCKSTSVKSCKYDINQEKKGYTVLGLNPAETETVIAAIIGALFLIIFVGGMMSYTLWYFKQ